MKVAKIIIIGNPLYLSGKAKRYVPTEEQKRRNREEKSIQRERDEKARVAAYGRDNGQEQDR